MRRFFRACPEAVDLAFKMRCSRWRKNCFYKEKQRSDAEGTAVQHSWDPHGRWSPPRPRQERGASATDAVRGPGPERAQVETGQETESRKTAEDWCLGKEARVQRAPQEVEEPVEEPIEVEAGAVADPEQIAE